VKAWYSPSATDSHRPLPDFLWLIDYCSNCLPRISDSFWRVRHWPTASALFIAHFSCRSACAISSRGRAR
jgi:hypothetical protein